MKTGKVWGVTELLLKTPVIEVHRLTIKPRSRCSTHLRQHKHNAFYVKSGRLFIEVEKSYGLTDRTELRPGEFMSVPPGENHRFLTFEQGCEAIEIYYPPELAEDIVRKDCGASEITG